MNIEIPKQQFEAVLTQTAEFINNATPQLEKLASLNISIEKFAKSAAENLADNGLIKKSEVDKVANDIIEGGVEKISELFNFVVKNVSTRQMGKTASDSSVEDKPLSAHDAFARKLGIEN